MRFLIFTAQAAATGLNVALAIKNVDDVGVAAACAGCAVFCALLAVHTLVTGVRHGS